MSKKQNTTSAACIKKESWTKAKGADIFSDDAELEFSHYDMSPEDNCQGTFIRRVITTGPDKDRVLWCCDKCLALMELDELITLAAEEYGDDWRDTCAPEPVDSFWDF